MNTSFGGSSLTSLIWIGIVLFIVLLIVYIINAVVNAKKEEKRCKDIENYCKKNNLQYHEVVKDFPPISKNFSVFSNKGLDVRYYAGMEGEHGDNKFYLFDYTYDSGGGKSRIVYDFTICLINNNNAKMPQFFVRDDNSVMDSIGKLFGGQDINFSEDEVFSPKFVLQGLSEEAVRNFFDSKVRTAFVNNHNTGFTYEGKLDCLMLFVNGRTDIDFRIKMLTSAEKIMESIVSKENSDNTKVNS